MNKYKGFSSIEMGITVLLIVVVMSVLVFFFNPGKKMAEKRNTQRTTDIQNVLNAISQYASENGGVLPSGIPVSENCKQSEYEMCKTNAADCKGLVVLEGFSNNTKYLSSLPVDPKSKSANGTGYNIVQNNSGRVSVCAPKAELGQSVSLSK